MTMPTAARVKVATDALRGETRAWDAQSSTLDRIANSAEGLDSTRTEAGIFQIIIGAYQQAQQVVVDRAREGAKISTQIGDTLTKVANTYDSEEAQNVHRLHHVY